MIPATLVYSNLWMWSCLRYTTIKESNFSFANSTLLDPSATCEPTESGQWIKCSQEIWHRKRIQQTSGNFPSEMTNKLWRSCLSAASLFKADKNFAAPLITVDDEAIDISFLNRTECKVSPCRFVLLSSATQSCWSFFAAIKIDWMTAINWHRYSS